jgi:hypothetical protein
MNISPRWRLRIQVWLLQFRLWVFPILWLPRDILVECFLFVLWLGDPDFDENAVDSLAEGAPKWGPLEPYLDRRLRVLRLYDRERALRLREAALKRIRHHRRYKNLGAIK